MTKQILLGGIVGGVVLFLASAVWHMVLPFGEVGVKKLPHEDLVLAAMRTTINEPAFYLFPTIDRDANPEEKEKRSVRYRQGPTGILVYQQGGTEFSFPKLLVNQFLIGLVAAFFV